MNSLIVKMCIQTLFRYVEKSWKKVNFFKLVKSNRTTAEKN